MRKKILIQYSKKHKLSIKRVLEKLLDKYLMIPNQNNIFWEMFEKDKSKAIIGNFLISLKVVC